VSDITHVIREDESGGCFACAKGVIGSEAELLDELRTNALEAVDCYFNEDQSAPRVIRLRFIREEVLPR
jgi:hypothetical protein